jgi:hypothetical protein
MGGEACPRGSHGSPKDSRDDFKVCSQIFASPRVERWSLAGDVAQRWSPCLSEWEALGLDPWLC